MHRRGSFYDIVNVPDCRLVDPDFGTVLSVTLSYFKERGVSYYHKMRHTGYLRHLLVRRAAKTGEILVDLVTTTEEPWPKQTQVSAGTGAEGSRGTAPAEEGSRVTAPAEEASRGPASAAAEQELLAGWAQALLGAAYTGTLTGILHTKNDRVADVIADEGTEVLFGRDYFYEELLGLRFKISPFSFFQTNSLGAEVLYELVREYVGDTRGKVVFDLYSGTGTIAQILAPVAKEVVGVEIVGEAVEAARENAAMNGLSNCRFIAGDVLKAVGELDAKPDLIVLDPPRDGIHPKALEKIIGFGVERMVYISCKPTSLVRDLEVLRGNGYEVERMECVDMFPCTGNIETVCLLSNRKPDTKVRIDVDPEDYYRIKDVKKTQN